mgnify:CR=1 FL=1
MYLNLGNAGFQSIRKGLYVDKSELISYMNETLGTEDKLICVSRPRRFGKSYAAKMLCAYYDKSCNSLKLFQDLKIASDRFFLTYLNKYDVLYLDITWFISISETIQDTVKNLQQQGIKELQEMYSFLQEEVSLPMALSRVSESTGNKFIIIIDEWDALFREAKENSVLQKEYIQLLRGLFKSSQTDKMIESAYMTGILPIKKYGTQSALTDFREYTMIQPKKLAEYVGFTEEEVKELCKQYQMNFDDMKKWYDGYSFRKVNSVYSPNSVIQAIKSEEFGTYWTETETYESLKHYISMDFDGLKEAIVSMLADNKCKISTRKFQNDITNMKSKDDVMTLLVHLGYLAFDAKTSEVYIPNLEVADEFQNAIEGETWEEVAKILKESDKILQATLDRDAKTVAQILDKVHMENTSILNYNDENALSYVVSLAYFSAKREYICIREFPSGKGYADIVFLPRKHINKPAIMIELKWGKSVTGAIAQIKEKNYDGVLKDYVGNVLLVGINYDKKSKIHECFIEKV